MILTNLKGRCLSGRLAGPQFSVAQWAMVLASRMGQQSPLKATWIGCLEIECHTILVRNPAIVFPDWCEVDGIIRIRGVYSKPLSNGYDILSMAGIAAVTGPAEDGLGTYVSTTSTGYTLGVGSQKDYDFGTVRFEITYDKFDNPSPSVYSKTLEVVSLRSTYMF